MGFRAFLNSMPLWVAFLGTAALIFLGLVVALTLRLLRNLGFFEVGEARGNSAGEKGR